MSRRRRRHGRKARRAAAGCVAVAAGWAALGHLAVLAVVLSFIFLILVFLPVSAVAPRRWRVAYRHAHGREGARSAYISLRQRRAVYAADRHRCVYCHSRVSLQVDHVLPWSHGGRTWLPNMVTLCGPDNRVKSDYWPGEGYRPFEGAGNIALAAAILAAERRARRNPLRWVRAALSLAA